MAAAFLFTQDLVDMMIENWRLTVTNPEYPTKPTSDKMLTLELCISDSHKPLLLANPTFIPYLISGLFLDADHPRGNLNDETKAWNQQMHCECFAQLALFAEGRDVLRGETCGEARDALQMVKERGLRRANLRKRHYWL